MKITIERTWKKADYTIGRLYVNGAFVCNTLEPADRGFTQKMTERAILAYKDCFRRGRVAIPTGTYEVVMSWAPSFKAMLPQLLNVPGFCGIFIHQGNTPNNTRGCILVGENSRKGMVMRSKVTLNLLVTMIQNAVREGEKVIITIR